MLVALIILWLLVLTVALLALIRHVAEANILATASRPFSVDLDGPELESEMPAALAAAIGNAATSGPVLVTFMSASCGPCLETARGLAALDAIPPEALFLVTARPGEGSEVLELLRATGRPIITDPAARELALQANIHSTPFSFYSVRGRVIKKTYLRSVGDFVGLAESGQEMWALAGVAS